MFQFKAVNEKCSGCRTCLVVCVLENFREINPAKSLLRIQGLFPSPGTYRIHLCDGCGTCAEVCPEAAIRFENGAFAINEPACSGCMICVEECPRGVIRFHNDFETPCICTRCNACVDACPRGAIRLIPEDEYAAGQRE